MGLGILTTVTGAGVRELGRFVIGCVMLIELTLASMVAMELAAVVATSECPGVLGWLGTDRGTYRRYNIQSNNHTIQNVA